MSTGYITIRLALAPITIETHLTAPLGAVRAEAGTPIAFNRLAGYFANNVAELLQLKCQIYQKSQ